MFKIRFFFAFMSIAATVPASPLFAGELDGNWVRIREACGAEISKEELESLNRGGADQRFSIARFMFDGDEYSKTLVPSRECQPDSNISDSSLSPSQNMYCGRPMTTEGRFEIRDTGAPWKTIWFNGVAIRRNEVGEPLEPGITVREKRFRREGMVLVITSDGMFSNCNFQQLFEYYVPVQGV